MRSAGSVVALTKRAAIAGALAVSLIGVAVSFNAHSASASTQGDAIAAKAASMINTPYCDDGGTINGPTYGGQDEPGCPTGTKGFDCMSLVQFAVYQVTGIALPAGPPPTQNQLSGGQTETRFGPTDFSDLQPGDATYWGGGPGSIEGYTHSGIYAGPGAGGGTIWDAVGTQQPVKEHTFAQLENDDGYTYLGAIRWSSSSGSTTPPTTTPPTTPGPPSLGGLDQPVVGMAATPSGNGYWMTNAAGGVSAHGSAVNYGSMAGKPLNAPIAHIVATPTGKGYWLVAADGGTFSFGDAGFYGSMGGQHLNAPVVDLAPTKSGKGYWLVASDGGIFAFGDAVFHGSMGGQHLNQPVVGIAADNATGGYWLVATDGGIFAFGAPYFGSTGSLVLNKPVNGMTPTSNDEGYLFVASDGGIFAFGDAAFHGSAGSNRLNAPVVGMAEDDATGGYWLVGSDGGIFSYGAPFYGAD